MREELERAADGAGAKVAAGGFQPRVLLREHAEHAADAAAELEDRVAVAQRRIEPRRRRAHDLLVLGGVEVAPARELVQPVLRLQRRRVALKPLEQILAARVPRPIQHVVALPEPEWRVRRRDWQWR